MKSKFLEKTSRETVYALDRMSNCLESDRVRARA
jgi:hypothetical protein